MLPNTFNVQFILKKEKINKKGLAPLFATSPDGKPLPTFKGIMVWTMTKENGNWYIKIMHNVSLPESN